MTTFDHTSYRLMVPWRSDDASKGMPAVRTCLEMLCDVSDRPMTQAQTQTKRRHRHKHWHGCSHE